VAGELRRCLFTELSKIALRLQSYEQLLYLARNQRVIRKVAPKMDGSSQRYSAVILRRDTLQVVDNQLFIRRFCGYFAVFIEKVM
jgi:hypothetical protein